MVSFAWVLSAFALLTFAQVEIAKNTTAEMILGNSVKDAELDGHLQTLEEVGCKFPSSVQSACVARHVSDLLALAETNVGKAAGLLVAIRPWKSGNALKWDATNRDT